MAMAATSSSQASSYHVFLSFRGEDTRHGFTGHLYKALTDKRIHTFIDDENLPRGEQITPALVKAIQGSKIAIIVLSKDYASSSFCLDELATIIHCAESKGLSVIPVFYMVDPSDVRHLTGSYGDALAKHEKKFKRNMDKLQKWKHALHQVADLCGYHFKQGDGYEYKFIGRIVESISKKVNHPARLHVGDYLVGLEPRVAEVMELLNVGSDDDVHIVGIHGMGGIGKSTLARAVYNNLISDNFDYLCFLENMREESNNDGLQRFQSILLQQISLHDKTNLTNWREGASVIKEKLQGTKVLMVLDDVDKNEQLQAILGRPYWFGPRSRVIITTRDEQLLKCHDVQNRYKVNELNNDDALQLLSWKAFKMEKADPTYLEVLNPVLTYASGLPLALEVIGSNLYGKCNREWKSAINQYKRIPHSRIQDILKVSFDTLQEEEKSVFIDIACCFKGYELKELEVILSVLYEDNMNHHIGVLVDKSLIKVDQLGSVMMHDLIQDMGRQIELQKSHKKPGKRKRLWLPKDIVEVLKHNKGTSEIEIIYLDVPISDRKEIIEWDGNGFKEMKNLKILVIKNAKFSEGPKCLPNSLTMLEWCGYPSNCLPSDFQPENFVICQLPYGCFTSFELGRSSKVFENLTVMKLDQCERLTKIPDLSDFSNLEKLSFEGCDNLVTVHESIGRLSKIKEINALGCRKLVTFPPIHLTSLEELNLSETGLESFPEISGKMENLRRLVLYSTPIEKLPISFVNLIGLQYVLMYDCGNVKLPSSILMMPKLTHFRLEFLKGMKWVKEKEDEETMGSIVSSKVLFLHVPSSNLTDDFFLVGFNRFAHVKDLILWGNNFKFLPECIKGFQSLRRLNLSECKNLQEIRGVPPNIEHLNVRHCKRLQEIRGIPPNMTYFNAINCESLSSLTTSMFINQELYKAKMEKCYLPGAWIPKWFDHKSKGPSTSFWFRSKLPNKILCLLITPVQYGSLFPPHPVVFINGKKVKESRHFMKTGWGYMDHTFIFELDLEISEVALEKEWNHVEVTYAGVMEASAIKTVGIHVFKQDIRFNDPCGKRNIEDDLNSSESDNNQLLRRPRLVDQQQNCVVSCLFNWACPSFPTQFLVGIVAVFFVGTCFQVLLVMYLSEK